MESFAFSTLLFCVYFIAACCFIYQPNKSLFSEQFSLLDVESADVVSPTLPEPWEVEEPMIIAQALPSNFEEEAEVEILLPQSRQHHTPTLEELLEGIDLNTIPLRPARKIAGTLGIAQKVKGKDVPLAWLRTQIKSRLSDLPTKTEPIILEVMTVV